MGLRKLSPEDKEIVKKIQEIREDCLREMNIGDSNPLTIDHIEAITAKVKRDVPGFEAYCKRNLEAFMVRRELSSN